MPRLPRVPREKKEKPKKEWVRLLDAETIVASVIDQFHPHLRDCRIICMGKPKAGVSGGKIDLAKIRKASEFHKALAREAEMELDYIIEIGMDLWPHMDEIKHRIPLIDHELTHATGRDEKGVAGLRHHDVEDFAAILNRHGLWQPELRTFIEAGVPYL